MADASRFESEMDKLRKREQEQREKFEREIQAAQKRAADARSSIAEATSKVENLEDRLHEVAGPALEGDEASERELARLEEEIDAQKRRWKLAETAAKQYSRQQTELEERRRESERDLLEKRYDLLARAKKSRAQKVESLVKELSGELEALLAVADQQTPVAQALGMRDGRHYRDMVEHRLTSALGGFLPSSRHWLRMDETLLEVDPHVRSLSEQREQHEVSVKRSEELAAVQQLARENLRRREEIERRRAQLRVDNGWDRELLTNQERARIDAQVTKQLRREFPENVETTGEPSELDEGDG